MKELVGTGVALVTPFNDDLTVDHDALSNIVNYNIENGTDYLVISGTTGESVTITKQEKKDIIKTISTANKGRLPLVLGIGGNNTAAVIEEIKTTDLSIFTAILSVSPYYSKPTQEGLYQHFKAIAEACPIPVILYNVPGRTSKNMEPATTIRLANDFNNIVAVKEAGNNVQQYLELLKDKPEDFIIISGDDDLALGIVLAGGSGVISVIGQALPKTFSKMIKLGLEGKEKEAYKLHNSMIDIVGYIFEENNPAGIKAVLANLGLCKTNVRLPLVKATEGLSAKINTFVKNFNS
jgi:4-hydroxy-tetrahydrodipicolinate synthase